eukprot:7954957-Pyramimonas_sp.AAC.1
MGSVMPLFPFSKFPDRKTVPYPRSTGAHRWHAWTAVPGAPGSFSCHDCRARRTCTSADALDMSGCPGRR